MKVFTRWIVPAAAMLAASGARAQVPAPYEIDQPAIAVYAALPPGPVRGEGPRLLPPAGVYTVLREGGFSPLGAPRQRDFVYIIAAINADGDDGRLVIDARDGRILRFMPAALTRDNHDDLTAIYGPVGPPRPPAPIPRRYASRSPFSAAVPRRTPHAVVPSKHVAARPKPIAAPPQQSASVQEKPAEAKPAASAPAPEHPPATIEPTQAMPPVQGFN